MTQPDVEEAEAVPCRASRRNLQELNSFKHPMAEAIDLCDKCWTESNARASRRSEQNQSGPSDGLTEKKSSRWTKRMRNSPHPKSSSAWNRR
jgi:hypothetical protein